MPTKPISITIDEDVSKKLDRIAADTHRKKSYYVNEALRAYFEEIEDYEIALSRRGGKTVTLKDAKKDLGIWQGMYKVEFEKRCLRELKRLDRQVVVKAFEIIENRIAKDPHNAKALTGPYRGLFSCRYGDYRIVYEIIEDTVTIVVLRIGHRKNVYDGL